MFKVGDRVKLLETHPHPDHKFKYKHGGQVGMVNSVREGSYGISYIVIFQDYFAGIYVGDVLIKQDFRDLLREAVNDQERPSI